MSTGPELTEVEHPFINQLIAMGWRHSAGSLTDPAATGRESFRDVLLLDNLKQALCRINLDPDGKPWLDEGRITQAVGALQRLGTAKLLEANQAATELLLKGTVVNGVAGWEQGRQRKVQFIDRYSIREAELLQAIARVNRTYSRGGFKKDFGIVVDYYGVARDRLCAVTVELVDHIQQEIGIVGFWNRAQAQEGLRS